MLIWDNICGLNWNIQDLFMKSTFKTVGILGRIRSKEVIATVKTLITYLQNLGQAILIDAETGAALKESSLNCISRDQLSKQCDLLIVVGGDGSLLHAAHTVIEDETPILGINRGRLGFLTDIRPHELNKIQPILEGAYQLEKRFLISVSVELQDKILGQGNALNEVAMLPDTIPHLHEFEIYINDQFVCSQESDGLIVATPTGSTAYALSGGGPILHPQLDALVLVPMFPHTLNIRPIVIEGNNHIKIIITPNNLYSPRLCCDGQTYISTPPGSHISILKKQQKLHLIHPIDYDYYETLRSKLHWGRKLQYIE